MSLICNECEGGLHHDFDVLSFLGNSDTRLETPRQSQARVITCPRHFKGLKGDWSPSAEKGLVFSVSRGIPIPPENFNGCYSMDQELALGKSAEYGNPRRFTISAIKEYVPRTYKQLRIALSCEPSDSFYRSALEKAGEGL